MKNFLDHFFSLREKGTTVRREFLAGLTTFSTMAYVIVVNPLVLSKAGIDPSSALFATIVTTVFSTVFMGLFANYPFALAPGMAMNAYFTYSVVIGSKVSWQSALGIVFLAGLFLAFLWLVRWREWVVHAIPETIRRGTIGGIGLFLILIGLGNAKIVVPHPGTFLSIGNLLSAECLLALFGIILAGALLARGVSGAIFITILLIWILGLMGGVNRWEGIFGWPHFPKETFLALDLQTAFSWKMSGLIFGFVFISLFDTTGSLMGLSHQGRFLDQRGRLPHLRKALLPDAIATSFGSIFGTSPIAIYLESASGIAVGGRSGLSNMVVAALFVFSLFLGPLITSIPLFATTPALVIVGALMVKSLVALDVEDVSDLIPCFMTIVMIPFTYSVGVGIGIGICLYPLCKLFSGKVRQVHPFNWVLALCFALWFGFMKFGT